MINLSRMNRVRAVDTDNNTMTVEAGCVLASLQAEADRHGRLFPLSLGAEGSCEIGGNLSTNAGGTGVLRYGNTRELVLGLEVVLADGQVWNGLRGLRKDNTGYDLKHLFVGAEGTLGIITAAVLKLFPKPRSQATAFVAIDSPARAVALLGRIRESLRRARHRLRAARAHLRRAHRQAHAGHARPVSRAASVVRAGGALGQHRRQRRPRDAGGSARAAPSRPGSRATPPCARAKRSARRSGGCARTSPRRRSWTAPR